MACESYLLFFLYNNSGGREGGEGVGNPAPVCGGHGPRIRLLISTQQLSSAHSFWVYLVQQKNITTRLLPSVQKTDACFFVMTCLCER
jgi:hypothetical protein